ncbi:L,D-transpeptidase family protein [Hansschlegelia sp. KR7-227]|uniref:L,D-transpeptidase family protein n=1 Tax=Hansschlegelia sp. KR7-227 TaxID=3400914 RepID=UPI003C0CDC40
MKSLVRRLLVLALLSPAAAMAAPPPDPAAAPPELTEQAIDGADFDGWRARVDARAQAKAAQEATPKPAKRRKDKAQEPAPKIATDDDPNPFLIRVQILLDRAHASPGAIDGRDGDNLKKAVRAFRELRKMPPADALDAEVWSAISADAAKATKIYAITPEDIDDRYLDKVPKDYAKLAKLKWIGFTGPEEMLAERFHMSEALLRRLNPGADFRRAGQSLLVAETGGEPEARVARIEIDKAGGELRAYAADGTLVLVDPATVGSDDTPSPSGRMKVNGSFPDPHYKYDPKKNFQQGRNRRKLDLPPGPNGPVGSMWIDLSKPTYGIHGTPDPDKISKSGSHGCVRLTNWDAAALGRLVDKGKTEVEFR